MGRDTNGIRRRCSCTIRVTRRNAERYEALIRLYIAPALGHRALDRVATLDITGFESDMLKAGQSRSSVQLMHAILCGVYRYASLLEVVNRNSATTVPGPPRRRPKPTIPPVNAVIAALRVADAEYNPRPPTPGCGSAETWA